MGNARSKVKSEKNNDSIEHNNQVLRPTRIPIIDIKKNQIPSIESTCNEPICTSSQFAFKLAADKQQYQQRSKQTSSWSLASLRLSYSISKKNSTKKSHRHLTSSKSFSSVQQQQRCRVKTYWPKPVATSIFSSHFKDCNSRDQEFHTVNLIAKGGFGVVFKVIKKSKTFQKSKTLSDDNLVASSSSESFYALKVLQKSKIIAEKGIQQVKDEADIQKVCSHNPFIVKQIDLWQNRYNLYILTEYMPNGELFSNIEYFSLDLIRIYIAEIALALDFLHNAGIIYRDVKPENILLTHDYHLKLTDFGLSKRLKIGESTRTMCGTLQYMAPEILKGLPYTHAVDWWALGVLAYEMFTQEAIHVSESIIGDNIEPEIMKSEKMNTLPYEGQDVLKRLLTIDPKSRIRSVRALQRIAIYKDFKIDADTILKMSPYEIIRIDEKINSPIDLEFTTF